MPNNSTNTGGDKRFARQVIIVNDFYQMPRFLTAGEFAGDRLSNNARVLYTLLLERHKLSVKNGWLNEKGEVFNYFKREEMEAQLGLSERTVLKVMHELINCSLVEETHQGLNMPNKIYLLFPVVGDDENAAPYLDAETDNGEDSVPRHGISPGEV